MTENEHRLRVAMNNLILMIALNEQFRLGIEDFEALLSISDFEKRIFEQPTRMSKFTEAKDGLYASIDNLKNTFGKDIIAEAYDAFKAALSDDAFRADANITATLSMSEAAAMFNTVFQRMKDLAADLPDETDGYSVLIHLTREIKNPGYKPEDNHDVCPYCNGIPTRTPKADFFGKNCDDTDGYVFACECGAYAYIGKNGKIIGTMADAELHGQRKSIRKLVFELCALVGLTVYEGCRWLSWASGTPMHSMQDIERMSEDDYRNAISAYDKVKERVRALNPEYPHTHRELMRFLEDGGRMMVLNAYGYKYGRVFVPINVGSEAIRVRYNKVVQEIMLPKDLDYSFDGGFMTITHPSGKREKYKLFTKEHRTELYKEDEKDV
mgnify:CR=1 FL=1